MKVNISTVPTKIVPAIWDVVFPFIKDAVESDIMFDEDSLKKRLMDDKALMFIVTLDKKVSGCCIVCIEELKQDACNIISLGGENFKVWKNQMNETITTYAKEMGCAHIVACGKKGWKRIWPDFEAGNIVYRKKVA